MTQNIKAIIFDLGGVLIDLDKAACISAFQKIGYAKASEMLDCYAQKGALSLLEEGKISPDEFHDAIRSVINKPVTDTEIDNALNTFLLDIPDYKLNMLLKLKEKYRIYMLSNTNKIMMDHMLENAFRKQGLTVDDYFDKLFLSYEMKLSKPNPEIFESMLSEAGIRAEETLYIDDAPANIEMAKAFGGETYLAAPQEDYRFIFDMKFQ